MKSGLVWCLILLVAIPVPGGAFTYYVNPDAGCAGCSDNNTCTQIRTSETTAADTISKAVSCATAGDMVELRTANYNAYLVTQSSRCPTGGSGADCAVLPDGTADGNRFTIRAFAGDSPVIKPTAPHTAQVCIAMLADSSTTSQYITIGGTGQGIKFDASACAPTASAQCGGVCGGAGTHHVSVIDNEITGAHCISGCAGIWHSKTYGTEAAHTWTIQDNWIHDNGFDRTTHGIYIQGHDNVISANNLIEYNCGSNITLYQSNSPTGSLHDNTVTGNVLQFNNKCRPNRVASPDGTSGNLTVGGPDNVITNNKIRGSGREGIQVQYYSPASTLIAHNTVCDAATFWLTVASDVQTLTVKNNIAYPTTLGKSIHASAVADVTLGTNLEGVDPLFLNGCSDVRLTATSPAIDTGETLAAVTTDFAGESRPKDGIAGGSSTSDIGMYEYGLVTPNTMVFVTPPANAQVGASIPVVSCAKDINGVTDTTFTANVTLTLTSGTGSLTGGGATAAVSGCASHTVSIDTAGTGKRLTATAASGADPSEESAPFEITTTSPVLTSGVTLKLR